MTQVLDGSSDALFSGDTLFVARNLIGRDLLRIGSEGKILCGGRIVETEAYLEGDKASHAFRGLTARNRAMFLAAGHVYVYRIYGIHHCVNIVTREVGIGEAVLIRAIEPLFGIDSMMRRRWPQQDLPPLGSRDAEVMKRELCRGPGNLCRAMGIDIAGFDSTRLGPGGPLNLNTGQPPDGREVRTGHRIGISRGKGEERPWRFALSGSAYLSRRI